MCIRETGYSVRAILYALAECKGDIDEVVEYYWGDITPGEVRAAIAYWLEHPEFFTWPDGNGNKPLHEGRGWVFGGPPDLLGR